MNKILRDKYLRTVFGISFFIFLFTAAFVFSKFFNFSGPIIIHFDIFKGIDAVGGRAEVFGILGIDLAVMAVNFLLADFIYQRERFMSYLISFATLIFTILFLASIIVINSANLQ